MSLMAKMIVGFLAFTSVPTFAAEPLPSTPTTGPYRPGFFYMNVSGFGQVQQRPSFSYGGVYIGFGFDRKFLETKLNANVAGGGPAVTFGYTLSRGALSRIGRRTRVEFAFSYFRGSGSDSTNFAMPYGTLEVNARLLDGTNCCNILRGVFETQRFLASHSLRVSVNQFDNGLRLRTDFEFGRRFTATPSFGIVGGGDSARYRYSFREELGTYSNEQLFPYRSGEVKETISSYYFGGEVGLSLKFQATRKLVLHGGATLSIFHRKATITGEDCYALLWRFFDSCVPGISTSTVRVTGSKTGYAVGLTLGATYDFGWMKVSLSGFGRYDSAVPGAENPEFRAPGFLNHLSPVNPARVRFFGEWSYGGILMLSFPLG